MAYPIVYKKKTDALFERQCSIFFLTFDNTKYSCIFEKTPSLTNISSCSYGLQYCLSVVANAHFFACSSTSLIYNYLKNYCPVKELEYKKVVFLKASIITAQKHLQVQPQTQLDIRSFFYLLKALNRLRKLNAPKRRVSRSFLDE